MDFPRFELPFGYIQQFGDNEILLVSTIPDPAKLRIACPVGSLGAVSFCMLRESDGYPEELVLLQGKLDERERHSGRRAGEATLHLMRPADGEMVRVFEMRHDGVRFDVPVTLAGNNS